MSYLRIMMIGGNNTSDRFGAALAQKITKKVPDVSIFGVGGPLMSQAGVSLLCDISEMVSLGVFDSLKGAQLVKRLMQRVSETMEQEKPDVVLQIGLPVFNFRMLEMARHKGIKTLYYYTPLSRGLTNIKLENFAELIDQVAGISRFEMDACQKAGIKAEFVGHPLIDLVSQSLTRDQARETIGLDSAVPVLSLLPGAREVEVKNSLPAVLKAIRGVKEIVPQIQTVISVAPTVRTSFIKRIIQNCRGMDDVKLSPDNYTVLAAGDLAITSIGTPSIEAALTGVPCLAAYRVPTTTFFFDKFFSRKPHMTVANNVLGEKVIPEFIQSEFGQSRIANEIVHLLQNEEARQQMLAQFATLPGELGELGSIERAADFVINAAAESHSVVSGG